MRVIGPKKTKNTHLRFVAIVLAASVAFCVVATPGCKSTPQQSVSDEITSLEANDPTLTEQDLQALEAQRAAEEAAAQAQAAEEARRAAEEAAKQRAQAADAIYANLRITQDMRPSFVHGPKGAEYQKYIVLHDTEGEGSAASVVNWWDSNGQLVAAHFVINKDGSIVQCAPLDTIIHHAGFGDTGHNALFGVTDESRDDKLGTKSIGSWAADYGMNSYSIGIEMVHVGGSGGYPEAQLVALDGLIAYIDAYYGFQSTIIDHKAWRSGNSDTSREFAQYLVNYQSKRTHI